MSFFDNFFGGRASQQQQQPEEEAPSPIRATRPTGQRRTSQARGAPRSRRAPRADDTPIAEGHFPTANKPKLHWKMKEKVQEVQHFVDPQTKTTAGEVARKMAKAVVSRVEQDAPKMAGDVGKFVKEKAAPGVAKAAVKGVAGTWGYLERAGGRVYGTPGEAGSVWEGLGDKRDWQLVPLKGRISELKPDGSGYSTPKIKSINPGKSFTLYFDLVSQEYIVSHNASGKIAKRGKSFESAVQTFRQLEGHGRMTRKLSMQELLMRSLAGINVEEEDV